MNQAILSKVATEALKPTSSIIDALLGPKLQRIRNWAEERDLKDQLGRVMIDELLEDYLRRILRRISGIQTIVFPNQELPLTDIYEPLQLSSKYVHAEDDDPDIQRPLSELVENKIIVDAAGMGKSTYAKHLALETLANTHKIPLFLELRRIDSSETLLDKLAIELDPSGRVITAQVLQRLLNMNEFVVILDGLDEVPEQTQTNISEQISDLAVATEKSSFVLTSRPEVALPDIPDSITYEIEQLSKDQAESLVRRYDAVANIDVGDRLVAQFDEVAEEFLKTPLLIVLLYRTFGFNQSIATRVTSFYDDIYNAFYKGHDLTKTGFNRLKASGLDSEDFRRLLRGFSFILHTRQIDNIKTRTEAIAIIDKAVQLAAVTPSSSSAYFDDLLLTVPVLMRDGTDFRFIHKSIGEFFAAEFLAYRDKPDAIIERIRTSNLYQSFSNVLTYLAELNPILFRRTLVLPMAQKYLDIPKHNSIVRSLDFSDRDALIGLWPESERLEEMETRIEVMIEASMWMSMAVDIDGQQTSLVYAISTGRNIHPSAVLSALRYKYDDKESRDALQLAKYIHDTIGISKWIKLRELEQMHEPEAFDIDMFTDHIVQVLSPHLYNDLVLIDESKCREIISMVANEENALAILDGLIADGS